MKFYEKPEIEYIEFYVDELILDLVEGSDFVGEDDEEDG